MAMNFFFSLLKLHIYKIDEKFNALSDNKEAEANNLC